MTMKEIGGYIEMEHYHGSMLHEEGIKLDSARNALKYILKAQGIRQISIPSLMCDSVFDACSECDVQVNTYQIGYDFLPADIHLTDDEALYLVNYYGQLSVDTIRAYRDRYRYVIVDNIQAYFSEPVDGVDTIYTCRKFFGVADGAILYTRAKLDEQLEPSESFQHMTHLLGRFERSGFAFFQDSIKNNDRLAHQPIRQMSKLTDNLLHSIDYGFVKERRTQNFIYLHEKLSYLNELKLVVPKGAFAYPFLVSCGSALRKDLIKHSVYVPTLWPNVVLASHYGDIDYTLSEQLLPLPCDQRYSEEDMNIIVTLITKSLGEDKENDTEEG